MNNIGIIVLFAVAMAIVVLVERYCRDKAEAEKKAGPCATVRRETEWPNPPPQQELETQYMVHEKWLGPKRRGWVVEPHPPEGEGWQLVSTAYGCNAFYFWWVRTVPKGTPMPRNEFIPQKV